VHIAKRVEPNLRAEPAVVCGRSTVSGRSRRCIELARHAAG